MRYIADTHVHLYPCYDMAVAFNSLRRNLSALDSKAVQFAFLAERHDCHIFADFQSQVVPTLPSRIEIDYLKGCIQIKEQGYNDLYLFPGRQIITQERIEILSLTIDQQIDDGLPASEVLTTILKNGGIPVINWAPGKWFFKRKQVVRSLLDTCKPGSLFIGDTTLRPKCWPTPLLMQRAKQQGCGVICGSDPLPFPGEEKVLGSYAIGGRYDFNPENPLKSVQFLLQKFKKQGIILGNRGGLFSTLIRLVKNHAVKE